MLCIRLVKILEDLGGWNDLATPMLVCVSIDSGGAPFQLPPLRRNRKDTRFSPRIYNNCHQSDPNFERSCP